jgi:general secretion pathway protein G
MKTNKKSGFTLIELMVVAIIVAILAAVAIPLMSANKDRAIATEGQAGCGAILTACKVQFTEDGAASYSALTDLGSIASTDLDGNYFESGEYTINVTSAADGSMTGSISANDPTSEVGVSLDVSNGDWTYSYTAP